MSVVENLWLVDVAAEALDACDLDRYLSLFSDSLASLIRTYPNPSRVAPPIAV